MLYRENKNRMRLSFYSDERRSLSEFLQYSFPSKETEERDYDRWLCRIYSVRSEGQPKAAMHLEKVVQRMWEKYNKNNVIPLPKITPHVFRHTFCTNMANAGMDIKSLQYLMGHADVSVTMNVYTHNSYEKSRRVYGKNLQFQ